MWFQSRVQLPLILQWPNCSYECGFSCECRCCYTFTQFWFRLRRLSIFFRRGVIVVVVVVVVVVVFSLDTESALEEVVDDLVGGRGFLLQLGASRDDPGFVGGSLVPLLFTLRPQLLIHECRLQSRF